MNLRSPDKPPTALAPLIGKLPKEFDPANLTNLFVDQFVTWDEVHRKVITGSDYV